MKRMFSVLTAGIVLSGCGGGGGSWSEEGSEAPSSSSFTSEAMSHGGVPGLTVTDSAKGPFSVLGTIDKLTSEGLVLSLNNRPGHISVGKEPKAFLFGTKIPMNAPYSVTVEDQPINPTQFCKVTNGTGIATKTVDTVSVSCAASTKFAIVAQKNASGSALWTFDYNETSGALSSDPKASTALVVADTDTSKPMRVLRHPTQSIVYLASEGAQTITGYRVGEKTGSLTKLNTTFNLNPNVGAPTLSSRGTRLYSIYKGSNELAVIPIDAAGEMGSGKGYTLAAASFQAAVGSVDDKHIYLIDQLGTFRIFSFDASGEPVLDDTITGYGLLSGLAATPNGKFAYASSLNSTEINSFVQDANGVLKDADDFDFPGDITNVTSLTIDPTGSFLFGFDKGVSSASAVVWKIDQASGALTFVGSTPVDSNTSPDFMFDNVGHFVYITALNTGGFVRGFSIDASTGALTEVTQPATSFESAHALRLY